MDSALDGYLLDEEGESARRRELVAARDEPSLEAFLPKRGEGLALSATDIELYRTCPLKYKFARVFGIPQEQTINQRFGIVIHQVLERYHSQEGDRRGGRRPEPADGAVLGGVAAVGLRRVRRRAPVPRARHRGAAPLPRPRVGQRGSSPRWVERKFDFQIGPHHLRGRVDRVDELPDGGYELIDYKTGDPRPQQELESDIQLAIYRLAAREAWRLDGGVDRQLLVRARRREGRRGRLARRPRARRGHGAGGRRGHPRPGLRAPALAGDLLLVRLQADLPGV